MSPSQGDSAVPSCCDLPACAELSSLLLWVHYLLDSPVQYVLLLNVFDAAVHHRHKTPQTHPVCWFCVEKEPSWGAGIALESKAPAAERLMLSVPKAICVTRLSPWSFEPAQLFCPQSRYGAVCSVRDVFPGEWSLAPGLLVPCWVEEAAPAVPLCVLQPRSGR